RVAQRRGQPRMAQGFKATRVRITQRVLDAAIRRRNRALEAAPQTAYRERIRDDAAPGLFLDMTAKGGTWFREYRPAGFRADGRRHSGRSLALGTLHDTSIDEAR